MISGMSLLRFVAATVFGAIGGMLLARLMTPFVASRAYYFFTPESRAGIGARALPFAGQVGRLFGLIFGGAVGVVGGVVPPVVGLGAAVVLAWLGTHTLASGERVEGLSAAIFGGILAGTGFGYVGRSVAEWIWGTRAGL